MARPLCLFLWPGAEWLKTTTAVDFTHGGRSFTTHFQSLTEWRNTCIEPYVAHGEGR